METQADAGVGGPGTSVGEALMFPTALGAALAAIAFQALVLASQVAVAPDVDGPEDVQLDEALQRNPVEPADIGEGNLGAGDLEGNLVEVPSWRLPPGHPPVLLRLPPGHPPICEPDGPPQPADVGPASPARQEPAEPEPVPPPSWRGGPLWV